MLSRESFKNAIDSIRRHDKFIDEINDVCRKYEMNFFDHDPGRLLLDTLMEILSDEMDDECGCVIWWLHDKVEKIVSWDEDGHEIVSDVTDLDALYDFIVANAKERSNKS